jgi:trehalose/maltose hydrolase-like predicted phosphorylase
MQNPVLKLHHYDPKDERRRESLLSLGNGFLLVRSALPWGGKGENRYPGTYAAGCYNTLPSNIAGETVWEESIVNLPDALSLSICIESEPPLTLEPDQVLAYEQELDLQCGIMIRTITIKDAKERITEIREERFVSMSDPNIIGQRITLIPQYWSGTLAIRSAIDCSVINGNIEKHQDFSNRHLVIKKTEAAGNRVHAVAETSNSGFRIQVDAVAAVTPSQQAAPLESDEGAVGIEFTLTASPHAPVACEQLVSIWVAEGREPAEADHHQLVGGLSSFSALRQDHVRAWKDLWRDMRFQSDDDELSFAVHLTLFHLLQNYSPNSIGRDVGFPARGWQEVYRGQIFWDEMFAIPVLSLRFPALAREMLMYRYCRLDEARRNARERGLEGALYPWRSAQTGSEVTPQFQKFMKSGRWHEDHTDLQVHINGAIAWNIFHHSWATGDRDFLERQGLEMLVELARMWASVGTYDEAEDRFHIHGIVGPDEFHTHHTNREDPGLSDNAYTNMLAAWTLGQLLALLDETPSHRLNALHVTDMEMRHWDHLSRRLHISFAPSGIVSQFAEVELLPKLDPDQFGDANAQWELEAEGRDANDYQLFKQADFAMLLYLFRPDELVGLFDRLGYMVTADQLQRSLDYYHDLTTHSSSLSEMSYAAGLAFFDKRKSWEMWRKAMAPDLDPAHAGGTAEGLHLGAMAASVDTLQRRYLGLIIDAHGLRVEPELLDELRPLRFTFLFRGGRYELQWDGRALAIYSDERNDGPLVCHSHGRRIVIPPGDTAELAWSARSPAEVVS